jgi:uncharacterized protein (UPF0333 family)
MQKIKDDNRGVTHLLYVVLVVAVIVVIAVVGWYVFGKNKTKTNSNASSSTTSSSQTSSSTSSSCLATYHDSNLCHFAEFSNNFTKSAYTATITESGSSGNGTMTLKNDGMGNTELTGTSGGSTINSITLDGTTYIQNNGSGPWIEYPTGTSSPSTNPTSNMNIGVGSSGVSFKYISTASCGSLTCYKYQVTDNLTPNATQYVYFDNSSYKLREWKYTDSTGTTDMTISYATVSITKPSPVESLSSIE